MNIKKHFCQNPQNIDVKFGVYKCYWNRDLFSEKTFALNGL